LETPPDPDGRVAALAARWTRGLKTPEARVAAVVSHLLREYSYSNYSDGRRTGLSDFLFDARKGNCEYFATAAAVLLRHAGVPTRLVTGFHADDWNEWGGFYDVRQNQAHAWIEAWIPGRGWTSCDATPGESGLAVFAEALSHRLARWVDAAQTRWYSSVVGYDQYTQRNTFLQLSFSRLRGGLPTTLAGLLRRSAPAALGLALLLWALRVLPLRLRRADEYERAERALARAGLHRRLDQTPREFAQAVSAARPELASVGELAEAHYRRRYAGLALSPEEKLRAGVLLKELKRRV